MIHHFINCTYSGFVREVGKNYADTLASLTANELKAKEKRDKHTLTTLPIDSATKKKDEKKEPQT